MDWGYIAGYFDGEGSLLVRRAHRSGKAIRCQLTWHNSDLPSLEAMRTFMSCGRIKTQERPPHKTMYTLTVADQESMLRVVGELIPRCIIKRERLLALRAALADVQPRTKAWGALATAGVVEITRLYHDEGWTQQRIGEHFGVGQAAVKNFMKRHGIPARSHGDAARQAQRNSPAWAERNRKISEARKREWADPEERARRIARMRAGQTKRLATLKANREARLAEAA